MSNINTSQDIGYAVGVWYQQNLLDVAVPFLLANQFGMKQSIPKNKSRTIKWGRFEELDEATTPLTEGVEPDGQLMQVTRMTATLEQYGDLVIMTDVDELTLEDNLAQQANIRLGQQMARTMDTLTFDVLVATGSIYNCQYGGNGLTPTEATQDDLDEVVQNMMNANGQFFNPIVGGQNKFGTQPLDESYVGIASTQCYKFLKAMSSWTPISEYPDPKGKYAGERGYTDNVRWCLSSKAPVDTSGQNDIASLFVMAQDSYGVVDIESGNVESIFTAPGGHGDRLRQKSSLGWKAWHAAKVLQDQWLTRVRATLVAAA